MTACRAAATGAISLAACSGSECGARARHLSRQWPRRGGTCAAGARSRKAGLVEKGIADPAVAPVQQGQVIVTAAEISRVEVPMNQGVRQAAAGKSNQSDRKAAQKRRQVSPVGWGSTGSPPAPRPTR